MKTNGELLFVVLSYKEIKKSSYQFEPSVWSLTRYSTHKCARTVVVILETAR
jgi:hypothetical protein